MWVKNTHDVRTLNLEKREEKIPGLAKGLSEVLLDHMLSKVMCCMLHTNQTVQEHYMRCQGLCKTSRVEQCCTKQEHCQN